MGIKCDTCVLLLTGIIIISIFALNVAIASSYFNLTTTTDVFGRNISNGGNNTDNDSGTNTNILSTNLFITSLVIYGCFILLEIKTLYTIILHGEILYGEILYGEKIMSYKILLGTFTYNFVVVFVVFIKDDHTEYYTIIFRILFIILAIYNSFLILCTIIETKRFINKLLTGQITIDDITKNVNVNVNVNVVQCTKWTTTKPFKIFRDGSGDYDIECGICMIKDRNIIYACGHFICCDTCSEHMYQNNQTCPLCKKMLCPMYKVNVECY